MSQAATSSTGTLVDSKTITEVPLTTRNFTQICPCPAGSAGNVNNAACWEPGSQNSNVNGNTAGSRYTVDGAKSLPVPIRILFRNSESRLRNMIRDMGHGFPTQTWSPRSGDEFVSRRRLGVRPHNIFNANDFFLNRDGRPRPDLKQNQFGGTLGEKIKKDTLFFFGSYQGTRQVNGLDNQLVGNGNVPPLTNDRSASALGDKFCPTPLRSRGKPRSPVDCR